MTLSDLRKYFNKRMPSGAIVLLVFGIPILLIGISVSQILEMVLIGGLMTAAGIFMIIHYKTTHSDRAVDNFCNTQADEFCAAKRAIVASSGHPISDAVYSSGYCFENSFSARRAFRGKDHVWRSSIFEMACLFFSEDRVYFYSKKMSLITDEKVEKQRDFRLQDIQMVSLEEINQTIRVAIAIPGNEKVSVNCRSREEAVALSEKIRSKSYKREQPESLAEGSQQDLTDGSQQDLTDESQQSLIGGNQPNDEK